LRGLPFTLTCPLGFTTILSPNTNHPLDVGITGWLLQPKKGADQGKIHQHAAEGPWAVLGHQNPVEMMGGVKDHDLPPLGRPVSVGELLHQQPILQLQPRQHGSGGDVAGLHEELSDPKGDSQGQQNAPPKGPGILRLGWGSGRTSRGARVRGQGCVLVFVAAQNERLLDLFGCSECGDGRVPEQQAD